MTYSIAISLYLLALMVYGLVLAHRKVKTTDGMVTGGHKIPFIILVGSLLARPCRGPITRRTARLCGQETALSSIWADGRTGTAPT